jgi:hypothetical protein
MSEPKDEPKDEPKELECYFWKHRVELDPDTPYKEQVEACCVVCGHPVLPAVDPRRIDVQTLTVTHYEGDDDWTRAANERLDHLLEILKDAKMKRAGVAIPMPVE